MINSDSPQPHSNNLVGASLTGVVVLAAIVIAVFTDHPVRVPFLIIGPLIMAVVWFLTRNRDVSGILISVALVAALIVTFLAI